MRTLFFTFIICVILSANSFIISYARFYSFETGVNFNQSFYTATFQSKKVYDNHYFNQWAIGMASKGTIKDHFVFSYGYGKHRDLNATSKLSISINLVNYAQFNQDWNTILSLNPSYMKRISPKSSYNIGLQIPMLQFQDSSFSDTVVTVAFNSFVGSGLSHRESSKYVKSIKKKFLWFWINDK